MCRYFLGWTSCNMCGMAIEISVFNLFHLEGELTTNSRASTNIISISDIKKIYNMSLHSKLVFVMFSSWSVAQLASCLNSVISVANCMHVQQEFNSSS